MKRAKEYIIAILAIGAFLGTGWVLLTLFGTSSVYFFAMMLIISAILLSILYVWKTSKAKKNTGWLRISKEKVLLEIKENYLETEKQLNTVEKLGEVDKEIKELAAVRRDMALLGCYSSQFEVIYSMLNRHNLSFLTQKKSEIDLKLSKIRDSAFPKCKYKLDEFKKNISLKIKDLKNIGFDVVELNSDTDVKNLYEAAKKFEDLNDKFSDIIKSCDTECANLAGIARSKNLDVNSVENELAEARKTSGLESLSFYAGAREKLNIVFRDEILNIRKIVENENLTEILESDALSEESKKELRDLISKLDNINNSSLGKFSVLPDAYKSCMKNAVYSAYDSLVKIEEILSSKEVPEWLWRKDARVYDYNVSVNEEQDLAHFNEESLMKINKVLNRYNFDDLVMRILDNYSMVEKIIEKALKDKGKVSEEDIKVSHAVEFLNLYKLNHPGKAHKITVRAPSQRKKEEEFELEIKRKKSRPKKIPEIIEIEKEEEETAELKPGEKEEDKPEFKAKRGRPKKISEVEEVEKEEEEIAELKPGEKTGEKRKRKRKTNLLIK